MNMGGSGLNTGLANNMSNGRSGTGMVSVGMQPSMMHPAPPSVPTMGSSMQRHQPPTPTFTHAHGGLKEQQIPLMHSTPASASMYNTGNVGLKLPNVGLSGTAQMNSFNPGLFNPNGPPSFQSKPNMLSSMPMPNNPMNANVPMNGGVQSSIPMTTAFQSGGGNGMGMNSKKIVTAATSGGPALSHIAAMGAGSVGTASGVGGVGGGQMKVSVPSMGSAMKMAAQQGGDGNCSPKSQASEGEEVAK